VELTTAAERLRFVVEDVQKPIMGRDMMDLTWPLMTGILLLGWPSILLKGIATDAEIDITLGGMPHNVTTEMDLALWKVAESAGEHRELLLHTPPDKLAAMFRDGTLPDIGLEAFLEKYGQRAAAEIDVGMPRWDEDPTPIFAAIANYLRLDDPEQAPDRRFERAAAKAEAKIEELARRARRTRPIHGRIAGFLMRRSRALTGLREIGKFAWLHPLRETRRQLLLIGAELAERGLLERAQDIMFLDLRETRTAVYERADHRELVGTDVEALAPAAPAEDGVLAGMAAAAGQATGRARVIRDPVGAHIEPGEILVAPTTDPGWTPLFMTTAGLVTETGSPVAHGPTVAREYGIPAVICVRNATQKIKTGQLITIDGAAGTVRVEVDEG
jgi:pyruvate,water dikinase